MRCEIKPFFNSKTKWQTIYAEDLNKDRFTKLILENKCSNQDQKCYHQIIY